MAHFELNFQSAKENIGQINIIRQTLRSFGEVRLTALQNKDEVIIGVGGVEDDQIEELHTALASIRTDLALRRTDEIEKKRDQQ